jgi:hypothetical protein
MMRTLVVHSSLVVGLWISAAQNPSVLAQNSRSGGPSAKTTASGGQLNPTAFEAEALGLKINLPADSSISGERIDGQVVVAVSDDPSTPTWTMRIQPLTSTLDNPSAAAQIDQLMHELKITKQEYQVVFNAAHKVGALSGQLCYLRTEPRPGQKVISGWLLLPTSDRTFMVFSMQTLPEHLARVRPLLESSFATIQLRSAEELARERKALLDAGGALIESFKPEQLKALVGLQQWHRVYTPAQSQGSPDTEIGYSLLEVLEAKKGAVEPGKAESEYDRGERTPGLMIRVQGRVVVDAQRGVYYDSIGLYWMAWDQSQETWSIRGTQWQGDAEWSEAETGIRAPYMPGVPTKITVIKSVLSTNSREPYDWLVPDVYLSQPLHWLLGRLLPTDITSDRQYRCYFYNFANRQAQLSQRTDLWGPLNDGSGNFRLITRLTSDSPPITTLYNGKGELVRRVHPDGSVTEPSKVEVIHQLWKSSGLKLSR